MSNEWSEITQKQSLILSEKEIELEKAVTEEEEQKWFSRDTAKVKHILLEKYKHPREFNWAWQYEASKDGEKGEREWTQFDCTDCLQLEFHYQAFKITEKTEFAVVELLQGSVDLQSLSYVNNDDKSQSMAVRRTPNNERCRPNAEKRHNPVSDEELGRISLKKFLNDTDLEWLSLNYRKARAKRLTRSHRRMILIMFQKDISYFPSMKEIRDELIEAQINYLYQKSANWNKTSKFRMMKNKFK